MEDHQSRQPVGGQTSTGADSLKMAAAWRQREAKPLPSKVGGHNTVVWLPLAERNRVPRSVRVAEPVLPVLPARVR
jgi:hypothetical protein